MAKQLKQWTHKELCEKAVKWLRRPQSQLSHGCHVAMSETQSGWSGEIPDAIGFRSAGFQDGSIVVEVKVSRSDFLADKKKPHRKGDVLGLGSWRYFLCPEGLIQPDELPDKWGLLWVTNRGGIKPIVGPAASINRGGIYKEVLAAFEWERDFEREQFILVKMLARVGDPEKLNNTLKAARAGQAYFEKQYKNQRSQLQDLTRKYYRLRNREEKSVSAALQESS
ncbi:hypothetical protein [Aliagarivorans taiwanensis]|uniref:hypothetical protein n=1 Tax=Aliagarivorans taiwanensis TaxID=561966 RepID=UPI0004059ED6|nr:hypothetical protein [Aliagarivorans taiwanensis]